MQSIRSITKMKSIIIDNDLQITWDEPNIVVFMTNKATGGCTVVSGKNFTDVCNKMMRDDKVLKRRNIIN